MRSNDRPPHPLVPAQPLPGPKRLRRPVRLGPVRPPAGPHRCHPRPLGEPGHRLCGLARALAPGGRGPDHLPAVGLPAGPGRGQDGAGQLHVRLLLPDGDLRGQDRRLLRPHPGPGAAQFAGQPAPGGGGGAPRTGRHGPRLGLPVLPQGPVRRSRTWGPCAPCRTPSSATSSPPCRGWPRSPASAASCASIRSRSPRRCSSSTAPPWARSWTRSARPTSTSAARPSRRTAPSSSCAASAWCRAPPTWSPSR